MVWMGFRKPASDSPMDSLLSWRALIAEYLGTLLLVFFGTLPSLPLSSDVENPAIAIVLAIGGPFAGGFAVGTIVKVKLRTVPTINGSVIVHQTIYSEPQIQHMPL
jgi:hypothetical protein